MLLYQQFAGVFDAAIVKVLVGRLCFHIWS